MALSNAIRSAKYRKKNKDLLNKKVRDRYHSDPEYRRKTIERAREHYLKQKIAKNLKMAKTGNQVFPEVLEKKPEPKQVTTAPRKTADIKIVYSDGRDFLLPCVIGSFKIHQRGKTIFEAR